MTELGADFHARLSACLASSDPRQASQLLREVQAATVSGKASGFGSDMEKLSAIAGVSLNKATVGRPEPLHKRAGPQLPPNLRHAAEAAIERIERANNRLEKADAMAAGRAVQQRLSDYWSGIGAADEIHKAQQAPRSTKGMWK